MRHLRHRDYPSERHRTANAGCAGQMDWDSPGCCEGRHSRLLVTLGKRVPTLLFVAVVVPVLGGAHRMHYEREFLLLLLPLQAQGEAQNQAGARAQTEAQAVDGRPVLILLPDALGFATPRSRRPSWSRP